MTELFLDLDGVVLNTIPVIVNMYKEDYKYYPEFTDVNPHNVCTWNFKECSGMYEDVLDMYFSSPRFFDKVEFMPYAKEALQLICDDYQINFVTIGSPANIKLKQKFLASNLLHVKYNLIGLDVNEFHNKSVVDMNNGIFIDDVNENLRQSNALIKIVFGREYPWNQNSDFHRIKNWKDLCKNLFQMRLINETKEERQNVLC